MTEYLSGADAAKLLGCSETLIRKRIKSGELDAEKHRGKWRILREDLERQERPNQTASISTEPHHTDQHRTKPISAKPNRTDPHRTEPYHVAPNGTASNQTAPIRTEPPEWRDDLLAQVARLEADKADASRREMEAGLREERSKARIIDLERELTVRDSRMADLQAKQESEVTELRGQVAILEAKVREILEKGQDTLEKGQDEALQLANRIADLVDRQQEAEARIHELQPAAEQVPMLQAAVEEKDATLSERERELQLRERELANMKDGIEAIASRPVAGPVFRLLTKGKLRV